jgi:RHS repeat-associated protein
MNLGRSRRSRVRPSSRFYPLRPVLVVLLAAAALPAIASVGLASRSSKVAQLQAKVLPPGPAPVRLPAWQRVPPGRFTGRATSPGLPTARQLFGRAGRPEGVKNLQEDSTLASIYGSVYPLMGKGNHLVKITLDPQNYQDAQGTWHKIDTSLVHIDASTPEDGIIYEGTGWTNEDGPVKVFFPDTLSPDTPVTWSAEQGSLSIVPLGLTEKVAAEANKEWVNYPGVLSNVDVAYTATAMGYKENVTFAKPPSDTSAQWDVQTSGLTLTLDVEEGSILIQSQQGQVGYFPAAVATDSSEGEGHPAVSSNFPYALADLGDGHYTITVSYDDAFLNDPATVYPVVLDPSPTTEKRVQKDTWAWSTNPNDNENGSGNLQAGGSTGTKYPYVKFDLSCCRDPDHLVYWAEMALKTTGQSGSSINGDVEVNRVTEDWGETTLTWNNKPNVGSTVWDTATAGDVQGGQGGWQYWDGLGDLYQNLIDQTYNHFGVRLTAPNTANWHVWCADDNGNAYCTPSADKGYLWFVYNDLPPAPAIEGPDDDATILVGSPTLSAMEMPEDPDGDDVRLNFQVSDDGTHWTGTHAWESGWIDDLNAVVDAGFLKDGQVYYWRIQSADWCEDIDDVCSNVDGDGQTHPRHASDDGVADPNTFTVNLPHYGTDSRWPMWTQSLGNGMSIQVNEATGNLFLSYPLDAPITPAGPLAMAITYNSQLASDLGMGNGWNVSAGPMSDGLRLPTSLTSLEKEEGDGVRIAYGDGNQAHFSKLAGNTYVGEGNDPGTVFKNHQDEGPDRWTYTSASGSVYTFDDDGSLLTAAPASEKWGLSGYSYTFTSIGGLPYLAEVRAPLVNGDTEQVVTFTYSGTPTRLQSIATWVLAGTQTWSFDYDGSNRLVSITDPADQEVDFGYDGDSDRLASVKDGQLVADQSSDATTITYDDVPDPSTDYRVTAVQAPPAEPSGTPDNPTLFCYDAIQNGLVVNRTAVVDPRGAGECPTEQDPSVAYTTWTDFNSAGLPIQVAGPYDDNSDLSITRMVWDGNGNLLCSESPEAFALDDVTIDCVAPADPDDLDDMNTPLTTYYTYQTDPPYKRLSVSGPAPDGDTAHRAETVFAYDEDFTGLVRKEFTNNDMADVPYFERVTNTGIDENWGVHGQPDSLPSYTTEFSLRYTGTLFTDTAGTYKFKLSSGGGVKLVIGKTLLLDCWGDNAWPNCGDTVLSKYFGGNKPKNVTIEYRYNDNTDNHSARLKFEWDQGTGDWEKVPVSTMAPALNLATTVTDDHGATAWAYPDDEAKIRGLASSMSREGRSTSWTYDDYARVLTTEVDPSDLDLTTTNHYTDDGTTSCRDSVTDAASAETTLECDEAGRVTASILHVPGVSGTNQDEQYRRVDTTYDDLGRVMHVSIPHEDGTSTSIDTDFVYDDAGRLISVTDRMGFVTTYVYDQMGRLTTKTLPDPDGAGGQDPPEYHYGYDSVGNQTTVVDPWGVADDAEEAHTWSTQYDALNRVVETTTPQSETESFNTANSYDLETRTVTVEVPGGPPAGSGPVTIVTVSTHDLLGRTVTQQVESIDETDTWTYDDLANSVAAIHNGISTVTTFDAFREIVQETCEDCGGTGVDYITYSGYDDAGRLLTTVDARGEDDSDPYHTWTYEYDEMGRIISSQLPDEAGPVTGAETTFVYDAAGEMIQLSQPGASAAIVRDYAFDVGGRLDTLETARGTTSYDYDNDDRLTGVTLPGGMPNGAVTSLQYGYDNLGRRIQRQGKVGQTVVNREQFAYDPNGNMISASTYGGTPPAVTIDYDFANRAVEVTENSTPARTTDYTYLGAQLASETDAAGTNDYTYLDGSGLLAAMSSPLSTTSPDLTYSYDDFGRVTTRVDGPSGLTSTVGYDANSGRVKSKSVGVTGGAGLACFERTYDEVGNVTAEARTASVKCSDSHTPSWNTYEYLNNNRLSEANEFGTTTTFVYDGAGNRTEVTSGGTTLITTFDGAGYPDHRDDNTDYVTDPLGQLTCVTTTTCPNGTQYQYDAWGRTSQAKIGSSTYTYSYDALDRTIGKSGAASATFSYVGTSQDPVLMSTGGSTFLYDYTRSGPLGQVAGSTTRFYLSDMHGDVVALVKPDHTSAGSTEFDAWGNKIASLTTGTQAYLGFQGDPTDLNTGWVDMDARNYVASLGRFMTQDPLLGDIRNPTSLNQFVYGLDSPLTMIDPDGRCPHDPDNPGVCSQTETYSDVVATNPYWWHNPTSTNAYKADYGVPPAPIGPHSPEPDPAKTRVSALADAQAHLTPGQNYAVCRAMFTTCMVPPCAPMLPCDTEDWLPQSSGSVSVVVQGSGSGGTQACYGLEEGGCVVGGSSSGSSEGGYGVSVAKAYPPLPDPDEVDIVRGAAGPPGSGGNPWGKAALWAAIVAALLAAMYLAHGEGNSLPSIGPSLPSYSPPSHIGPGPWWECPNGATSC